jgi:hypothetical protein
MHLTIMHLTIMHLTIMHLNDHAEVSLVKPRCAPFGRHFTGGQRKMQSSRPPIRCA